jgi:aspartyl-tRNA(Asn)/glutamyl-tRNA(Gln) amidotransferase subunit C
MHHMTKDDIAHLGSLSRLALTDAEISHFDAEINDILQYVSVVSDMAGDGALEKKTGAVYNQFRADEITTTPGQYTESLLAATPARSGQYFLVKKIIAQDE